MKPPVNHPCIHVVAALIERQDRFLVTQRRPEATLPLLWEFPGGHVESGESDGEALRRELGERLDIEVDVGELVLRVTHPYPRYDIDLRVYRCVIAGKVTALREPRPVHVNALRWASLEELGELPFPGADQATADALLE